ncbi:MAG: hypothetical protein Ct9H300mP6_14650 [Gammaproteobacteria bacterium]|nr:MAG: hypothetical protein Ct9H300mP6_14650 [Gammaproteobacteria bacterium]
MWVRDFDYTAHSNSTAETPFISRDRTFDLSYLETQNSKLKGGLLEQKLQSTFFHEVKVVPNFSRMVKSFGMPVAGYFVAPGVPGPPGLWFLGSIRPPLALRLSSRGCHIEYGAGNSVDSGSGNNSDDVQSMGIYASVDYDINEQLTLSAEARWQKEEIQQILQQSSINELNFDNILPRVILRYKASDSSMFYASYSKGVLPGKANDAVANATDRELAQYKATQPNVARFLKEEELDSIELGWKGNVGRVNLSVAVYQADWENQKGRSTAVINEDCRAADLGAANWYCASVGAPKLELDQSTPYYNVRNFNAMGDSEISGIEIEGDIQLNDNWSLNGTLGMADSEFNDYQYNFVTAFAGFSQMAGNTMPRYPEDMASLSATYKNTLNNGWDTFFRADLNYFGETYADESNFATCDSYSLINARGGIQRDNIRMEVYVSNVGMKKHGQLVQDGVTLLRQAHLLYSRQAKESRSHLLDQEMLA